MRLLSKLILLVFIGFSISCSSPPKPKKLYPDVSMVRVPAKAKIKKKTPVVRYSEMQRLQRLYGKKAALRVKNWHYLINDYQRKPELEKLKIANTYINQLRFIDDIVHWGKKDYWATPVETLASNGGDCEDFAIAKYYTLSKLGMSEQCLSLSYVKVKGYNKPHMVLVYQCFEEDSPLILDNLNPRLLSSKQRRDITTVYSFNADDMWIMKPSGQKRKLSSKSRMRLWDDLRRRVQKVESLLKVGSIKKLKVKSKSDRILVNNL